MQESEKKVRTHCLVVLVECLRCTHGLSSHLVSTVHKKDSQALRITEQSKMTTAFPLHHPQFDLGHESIASSMALMTINEDSATDVTQLSSGFGSSASSLNSCGSGLSRKSSFKTDLCALGASQQSPSFTQSQQSQVNEVDEWGFFFDPLSKQ